MQQVMLYYAGTLLLRSFNIERPIWSTQNGSSVISSAETGKATSNASSTSGCTMPNDPMGLPPSSTSAWRPGKNSGSSEGRQL